MSLQDAMQAEVATVFLNLEEFATLHEINGKKLPCIVDTSASEADTAPANGFGNPSGIGILQANRVVQCQASELGFRPLSGQKILMDGSYWIIGDNVEEIAGLLVIPMSRAY